ncbi:MAG TPA: FAD-dependent oxidoreductase [bacterium]|nr:FAD-dependent oxidoreductase [bacterium]HMW33805.1 FAD-dependent oxidoreductase [bacterium]HMW36458.1 FAD-dependent oxidoreductase [bacterium]HMY35235.1 FAD-dependent oxidoreductase [bacterium]HMZ05511.1 FAD-dependent oxidoreductase [bacterium]
MSQIIIIGNGITGTTVARHVRKRSDQPITIISGESDYFFSRTALMYIYMGHMKYEHTKPYEDDFWKKNEIQLRRGLVERIVPAEKQIYLKNGEAMKYDKLVIATGSVYQTFGWPGQNLQGVQGLFSLQDLELMERNTKSVKRAVIVGGGLIGIEMAEMLISRGIHVTFLVREKSYWDNILPAEESDMINRHIRAHHVDLRLNTELQEIRGNDKGRVDAIVTKSGEVIPCEFVGLTVGVKPNIEFLRSSGIPLNRGVLINQFLETPIADIYAAGDCAEFIEPKPAHPKIEQLWYTGRMQGEALARVLTGERQAYDRGIWFNSAKFFDIEYQTYGVVPNVPRDGEEHLWWEHPDGQHGIRIVFRKDNRIVIGFNLMGIRYRQNVCQRWIKESRTIDYVLQNLGEANCDPEFFMQYEPHIIAEYNRKYPEQNLLLQVQRGLHFIVR